MEDKQVGAAAFHTSLPHFTQLHSSYYYLIPTDMVTLLSRTPFVLRSTAGRYQYDQSIHRHCKR